MRYRVLANIEQKIWNDEADCCRPIGGEDKSGGNDNTITLFQLDGPIGVVEELLPAAIAVMAQVNM